MVSVVVSLAIFGAVAAFLAVKYFLAWKAGVPLTPPISFNLSSAEKLISAALAGNPEVVKAAALESFEIHWTAGSPEQVLLQIALADVERRVKDPADNTPVLKAIAHFTGLTEQQVFDVLKTELSPRE